MGSHNFKGVAILQRMSQDIRCNIYIAPEILHDILCNIYISPDVHVTVNIVAKNASGKKELDDEQLETRALDERLATTALNGARTAFNAQLAAFDTQLVRTALNKQLVKKHSTTGIGNMCINNSHRQYAYKCKHTRDRQQLNYSILIHVLRTNFLDTVLRRCCSFSASQSKNTLYPQAVFFLVFDTTLIPLPFSTDV